MARLRNVKLKWQYLYFHSKFQYYLLIKLGSQVPHKYKEFIHKCRDLHPLWSFKLWSDSDIDQLNPPLINRRIYDGAKNFGMSVKFRLLSSINQYMDVFLNPIGRAILPAMRFHKRHQFILKRFNRLQFIRYLTDLVECMQTWISNFYDLQITKICMTTPSNGARLRSLQGFLILNAWKSITPSQGTNHSRYS